jgi:hypothetical protein
MPTLPMHDATRGLVIVGHPGAEARRRLVVVCRIGGRDVMPELVSVGSRARAVRSYRISAAWCGAPGRPRTAAEGRPQGRSGRARCAALARRLDPVERAGVR